jgi:hypothetical protein
MASQFYVGHLTEYGLSLHDLFVFTDVMTWFAVPPARQPRVLLLGIGLALATCSALIGAGATALNHFGWLFYPLGGIPLRTRPASIRPCSTSGLAPRSREKLLGHASRVLYTICRDGFRVCRAQIVVLGTSCPRT